MNFAPETVQELPFYANVQAKKPVFNRHHGQRKLFVTELNLLCEIVSHKAKINNTKDILFVYAGAAPCMHIGYIMDLFPQVKFLLIDPNEFLILDKLGRNQYDTVKDAKHIYLKSNFGNKYKTVSPKFVMSTDMKLYPKGLGLTIENDNIIEFIKNSPAQCFIYEDYMSTDIANSLKNDDYFTVLMNDVRTTSQDDDNADPFEVDVLYNNSQVFNWTILMEPDVLMHKNRMQYIDFPFGQVKDYMLKDFEMSCAFGIDFIENFKKNMWTFFDGKIYLEPWVSKGSSETRLLVFKEQCHENEYYLDPFSVMPGPTKVTGPTKYFDFPDNYVPWTRHEGRISGKKYLSEENITHPYMFRSSDLFEYDQKMLYHNRANKAHGTFPNDISFGIDKCFDCVFESKIWMKYAKLIKIKNQHTYCKKQMNELHTCLSTHPSECTLQTIHGKTRLNRKNATGTNPEYVKPQIYKKKQ